MTYQALARKWRPARFDEVVGQEHVVNALTHALDNNRVHHAFLFTGTRGVGKTTLARLLAKSLNCEHGMTSQPCGECNTCKSVDEGRFIDLLEVDAASRTKVDDTRELLDNVQYAPTVGTYKVYLIDEVHMLSGHSFNALLKTLEEPPPHVKFLLATTDPQKLPVTVLSRCLQFNLRALTQSEIASQLERILLKEQINAEREALLLLSRAASGSMRDALSLLDQSIAFSGGIVTEENIRRMLGMIDDTQVVDLLEGLVSNNALGIFGLVDHMRSRSLDFFRALDDILTALHEIALLQTAPELSKEREMRWSSAHHLCDAISREMVQLYYQIALIGKRDLPIASDPAQGFEMVLLRMLAFQTANVNDSLQQSSPTRQLSTSKANVVTNITKSHSVSSQVETSSHIECDETAISDQHIEPTQFTDQIKTDAASISPQGWGQFIENSALRGLARELAMNLSFINVSDNKIIVELADSVGHLLSNNRHKSIQALVQDNFGPNYILEVKAVSAHTSDTPAIRRESRIENEKDTAVEGFTQDPHIKDFVDRFDAEILQDTIQPEKHRGN